MAATQMRERQGEQRERKRESEEGERRGRERAHQLFIEGNVKLPWIRQTAGSSPEKRENELE